MKPVSSPTVSVPSMIMLPPSHRMSTLAVYMVSWKAGVLRTATLNVLVEVSASSPLTSAKRSAT